MPRYRFASSCPACENKTVIRWNHTNCPGDSSCGEEIDEDGYIYCLGCNKNIGFIMDINFNCGNHDSRKPDERSVMSALSMMATMIGIPSEFGKKIIRNVLKRLD